ncbi:MAG TPA: hypothetical protein VD839_08045 [Burkholderiales bacterium]|nr:hypothetical protein [Burkholderiales bacterium]
MTRFLLIVLVLSASWLWTRPGALAQQNPSARASSALQQQLQQTEARRKDRIAGNMLLLPEEARRFWPVYEEYRAAAVDVRKRQLDVIVEYADAYNRGAIAPEKARELLAEAMRLEAERDRLKRDYIRAAGSVLGPTRQLRLYQVETRLDAEAQAGVLGQIPLAQ